MTYLEILVTITAISGLGNLVLQTTWFIWSHKIHERKHKDDE